MTREMGMFLLSVKINSNNRVVLYQTRETMFHRDIQAPRRELKKRHAAEYF